MIRSLKKTPLIILLVSFSISATSYAQLSLADHHNIILEKIILPGAKTSNIDKEQIVKNIISYASENGYKVRQDLTYQELNVNYIQGSRTCEDFINNIALKGIISNNVKQYIYSLKNDIENNMIVYDSSQLSATINMYKSQSNYKQFSSTDKQNINLFEEGFQKSFSFWNRNENYSPGVYGRKSTCRCGIGCLICVALIDAGGLLVPGIGIVLGPVASGIARCCICGCCNNVGCQ